ncbi:hypothetical protein FHL15_005807 [Xylaria flabelliformis]|uniref:Uncharacterized protein n=1 Tax=Xylaria flabelliformis TaxID=2512241 RepID=A0A553HZ49_9PEZI|nr:hypothetical protein FHL15_005807 [Xylaria flabelliformis]
MKVQQHDQQPHQLSCTESAGDPGIRKIEVMIKVEKEQGQIQYENDDPDEDDPDIPDIPDIHIALHPSVERTAGMQRFRLYSGNLVREYLDIKAGEIAQMTPGCQDECCQKEEFTTTLQDWEDMVYHDLMGSQWTDESILRFEPSHEMFKKIEDRDLDRLMQALRSNLNPDRARVNDLFPTDGELLQDNVSENLYLYPRDRGEGIYRMHCLRMKKLLDRSSFRLEEWVTSAAAMEWARRKALKEGWVLERLEAKYRGAADERRRSIAGPDCDGMPESMAEGGKNRESRPRKTKVQKEMHV